MQAGARLFETFDVWGGYHWVLRPGDHRVTRATVEALEREGRIVKGMSKRIYSGYHETPYTLAEAAS